MRRLLNVLLLVALIVICTATLPTKAQAATTASGTCGEHLTWTLDDVGTLTISGTGAMDNWPFGMDAPWEGVKKSIIKVVIGNGVTSVGEEAFSDCTDLQTISIPDSVVSVGDTPFRNCSKLNYNIYDNAKYLGNKTNPYVLLIESVSNDIASCEIHPKTRIIYKSVFASCNNLTDIVIPDSVVSVGERAFYECSNLQSVTIGNSVASIEDYTFYSCSNLKNITIGNSVKTIGYLAFGYCTSLTDIVLPDGVTTIESRAFSDCKNLALISVPDSIVSLSDSAFRYCNKLNYNIYDNGKYCGNETNPYVVMMGTVSGNIASCQIHPQTKFIYGSFSYCTQLTSITIPDGVIGIGSSTFSNCSGLTSITIPDSVTSIGSDMFYNCTSLTSVKLPDGITDIGSNMFSNCTSLTSVTIPDSVTVIAASAFSNCTSLISIRIPEGVTHIGWATFEKCTNLQQVIIGSNITGVDSSAFSGCTSLQYNLYSNAKYLGNEKNPYLFLVEAAKDITSCQIHPNTKKINNNAFYDCTGLTELTIPDGVVNIGYRAFKNCTNLQCVTLPYSVVSVDYEAFQNCTNLTDVYITDITAWCGIDFGRNTSNPLYYAKKLYLNGQLVKDLVIPEGTSAIGDYAFYNCSNLQSIVVPEGVTSIGTQAFKNCSQLKSVAISGGVTELVYGTFQYCTQLQNISLPNTLQSIGYCSFEQCISLENIKIPESVTTIDEYVFLDCRKLQSLTIPMNVASIDRFALSGCSNLMGIWVDKNNAYYSSDSIGILYDKNMTSLILAPKKVSGSCNIPASVTEIRSGALSGCSGLTGIWVDKNNENYYSDSVGILFNKDKTTLLQVPGGFSGTCTIPDSVTEISYNAFDGCSQLKAIVVDKNNANYCSDSLGVLFNKDMTKLLRVPGGFSGNCILPDSVTSFDSSAFDGCCKLTGILANENSANYSSDSFGVLYNKDKTTLIRVPGGVNESWEIPSSVTSLGDRAFQSNDLVTLTIPDNVTKIGEFTFLYCDKLQSVTLGKGIVNIGWGAFSSCENLTTVFYRGTVEQKTGIRIESYANHSITGAQWHYDVTDIILGSQIVHQCSCCEQYQYQEASESAFADIVNSSWQSKFAIYVCQNGLMAGKGTDANGKIKFDPNSSITREEFVQVLYNAEGKPSVSIANKFPDVGDKAWFKNAVLWANENNIANGVGGGSFGVGKNITRQDLAMMLYKYAKMKNVTININDGEIFKYADGNKVATYAREAMNWAVTNGVLSGKGTAGADISTFKLDPAGTATRAECAAMLKNFMTNFGM